MDESTSEITVVDAPERGRFEILVDGEVAGYTEYHDGGDVRVFPHTVIKDEYGGRGLATTLVRTVLDQMHQEECPILPQCPVIRGFIAKHPEYVDLVPEERREEFGLGPTLAT